MRFSIQCQKHYCKCDQISANLVGLIYFKMHFTEMEVNEWASGLAQFHKITYHQSVHDFEVFSHQKNSQKPDHAEFKSMIILSF